MLHECEFSKRKLMTFKLGTYLSEDDLGSIRGTHKSVETNIITSSKLVDAIDSVTTICKSIKCVMEGAQGHGNLDTLSGVQEGSHHFCYNLLFTVGLRTPIYKRIVVYTVYGVYTYVVFPMRYHGIDDPDRGSPCTTHCRV